jgi:hypothetical protein
LEDGNRQAKHFITERRCSTMIPVRFVSLPSTVLFMIMWFLVVPNARAQQVSSENEEHRNSLQEDAWALQFQVGDNFSLKAFQGLAISAKKHWSNTSALRVGIGLSISVGDADNVARTLPADTMRQSQDQSSNGQSVDITAQYLLYPNPDASVNVFFGAGPLFRYSRSKLESDLTTISGATTINLRSIGEEHVWAIGASGVVGVEWFAARSISFLGEYAISLEYSSAKQTRTESSTQRVDRTESEYRTKIFRVYPLSVKFGLSVYF